MSRTMHQYFYQYILDNEPSQKSQLKELTVDRIFNVFYRKMLTQHSQQPIFSQEFFRAILKRIAEILMNAVYKQKLPFIKLQQIVTVVGIAQHITYSKNFDLPGPVRERFVQYIHCLIFLESLQTMRTIFQDSRNSAALNHYYNLVYKSAITHRSKQLMLFYGLKLTSNELVLYALKCLIEQRDCGLEKYQSQVTSEWITLSLIYLTLSIKADVYRQKPVLAKILDKYQKLNGENECQRQINGDELCDFYNKVFLGLVQKLNEKELQAFIDDIKTDIDVICDFIVSPIQNQNNTVLDNIVFSSSWEP